MRISFEIEDKKDIAKIVVEELKPLLKNNNKTNNDDTIFDVQGLADYLRVSIKWVYERTHLNEIPFLKVGGHLRFRKKDIDKWLDLFHTPAANTLTSNFKGCEER